MKEKDRQNREAEIESSIRRIYPVNRQKVNGIMREAIKKENEMGQIPIKALNRLYDDVETSASKNGIGSKKGVYVPEYIAAIKRIEDALPNWMGKSMTLSEEIRLLAKAELTEIARSLDDRTYPNLVEHGKRVFDLMQLQANFQGFERSGY